jgi:hypothetical protein
VKRPANSRSGEALERAGLALRMNQASEAERLATTATAVSTVESRTNS